MSNPPSAPDQRKNTIRQQWDHAAAGWNEQTPAIRAWLADATTAMLDAGDIGPGARVLDVAAGAGDQTLAAAERVGPNGYVLATDLSPRILEFAQENARRAGFTNVATRVVDGEQLDVEDGAFDAAICRLGLMLYLDPLQGLRGMYRALRPSGRAVTLVFSTPQQNPCMGIVLSTAVKHAGVAPPDPAHPGGLMSLGRPGLIDSLFDSAGFVDLRTVSLSAVFELPTARDYVNFIRTSAGPVMQLLSKLDEDAKEAAWTDMEERLSVFQTASGWRGPNELLLTVGRRAG